MQETISRTSNVSSGSTNDRLRQNFQRLRRLAMQRGKNIRYANDLNGFIPGIDIDPVVRVARKKVKTAGQSKRMAEISAGSPILTEESGLYELGKALKDAEALVTIEETDITLTDMLHNYAARLSTCCGHMIGQINPNDKKMNVAVKTGRFCNHRLCNICNSVRAKKLRRKFYNFFNSNEAELYVKPSQYHFFPDLVSIEYYLSDKGKMKIVDKDLHVSGLQITEAFDFMHLTLTVPHKNGVWNGQEYYAKELLQRFHTMRKCDWWTEKVFAGEQCVETVQTENNLHIHIHALILVKKNIGKSRNDLYLDILSKWNELTVDHTLDAVEFSEERKQGLKNAVKPLYRDLRPKFFELDTADKKAWSAKWLKDDTNEEWEQLIEDKLNELQLDARGSTLVGLETLYREISASEFSQNGGFQRNGKFYRRLKVIEDDGTVNTKALTKGIMECLKYHFEPCSLEDENGNLNAPLLVELLPNIYRQRLYGKFGAFYGFKPLNVSEEPLTEDDMQEHLETAHDACYCPVTGEPVKSDELLHIVFDLKDLQFQDDGLHYRINPSKIKFPLPRCNGLRDALQQFVEIVNHRQRRQELELYYKYNKHELN